MAGNKQSGDLGEQVRSHGEIQANLSRLRNTTSGSEKYVIEAMQYQVSAFERLEKESILLRATIKQFNEKAGRQTSQIVILTVVIAVLTFLMLFT